MNKREMVDVSFIGAVVAILAAAFLYVNLV